MKTVLDVLKLITLICVIVLCVAAFLFTSHLEAKLKTTDQTITKVNNDLDEAHRLILETGLTAMEARKASAEERAALPGLTAKANSTFDNVNAAVNTLQRTIADIDTNQTALTNSTVATLAETQKSIAALQPVLAETKTSVAGLQDVEAAATKSLSDADRVIADPAIPATLANTAETTKQMAGTATDVRAAVNSYLHPTWKTRLFNYSMTVVHALGGWF